MAAAEPPDEAKAPTEPSDPLNRLKQPADLIPWIKDELKARGWEADDLARATSLKKRVVNNLLYNKSFPTEPDLLASRNLRKILNALGIDYDKVARRVGYPWSESGHPDHHETLGSYLRHRTILKEMLHRGLADLTGIHPNAIGRYFNNQDKPSLEKFKLIAEALGIDSENAEFELARTKYEISADQSGSNTTVPSEIRERLPFDMLGPDSPSRLQLQREAMNHLVSLQIRIDELRRRGMLNADNVVYAGLSAALLERQPRPDEPAEGYGRYVADRLDEYIALCAAKQRGPTELHAYLTQSAARIATERHKLPPPRQRNPRAIADALGLSTKWVLDTLGMLQPAQPPGLQRTARNMPPRPPIGGKPPTASH